MSNEKLLERLVHDAVPGSEDGRDVQVGGAADFGKKEALGVLKCSGQKSRLTMYMYLGGNS